MADLRTFVYAGDIARVKELLAAGVSIHETDALGSRALSYALAGGQLSLAYFLLVEGGVGINHVIPSRYTIWDLLHFGLNQLRYRGVEEIDVNGLSALLKVMVMLGDVPQFLIAALTPLNAELCTRGRQLRAQLPSYLEQQQASVIMHCPLPAVLQSLVAGYAATTPEDMWADGLRVEALQPKRPRAAVVAEEECEAPLRRSVRLRQKRGC
jgi:hypothetical protein